MGLIFLPCLLLVVGFLVLSLFYPLLGSRIFIGIFLIGLEGSCALVLLLQAKQTLSGSFGKELTSDEFDLINAYKLHFMYPGATRELSSVIAALGLVSLAFVPLLLWKGAYIEAAVIGVNWFVVGPLSHKLSPLPFVPM
jgi:hypothetical protein